MEQIFIRVKNSNEKYYDKDIKDSSDEEISSYLDTLSKGQVGSILKKYINNERKHK